MSVGLFEREQAHLEMVRAIWLPRRERNAAARAEVRRAEHALTVIQSMRALYADLRADAERVGPVR